MAEKSYPCTMESVKSLAELPQGEIAIKLLMQAGWNRIEKNNQGVVIEMDSLEDLLERVQYHKTHFLKHSA